MDAMPREPRSRIVLAVILTAAIGGMFMAGDGPDGAGVSVSSVPADQRVVQQDSPPVAAAPSGDEILTFTGRDPFVRDKAQEKPPRGSQPAPPVTVQPGSSGVAPVTAVGGVAVSVGETISTRSGSGSTRTSPTAGGGPVEPKDEMDGTPQPVDSSPEPEEPTTVDPAPIGDGGDTGSPEPTEPSTNPSSGEAAKPNGKPAKPKSPQRPSFEAFQRTKDKPVKSRGLHKGWSQGRRGKWGYSVGRGWGRGNAWGWRTKCKAQPHSQAGCRR